MTTPHSTPHPTPEAPHVAVRGEARLDVDPEIARIAITVSARGTDRAATLTDLTRRNAHTLDLVKSYGEAVEKLETGAFSITPEPSKHGRGERIRAYQGRVHLTVELSDFTTLGELTTRLADSDLTRVDGPWWALRPDSPAYAEARHTAVTEAVQRARAYATALGTTLTALLELSDTDLPAPPALMGGTMRMAFAAETTDAPPPLDLEPQRQTVTAEVMARFTMAPPQL
ncbi:SIMPL domain-containing protein [Streptomyces sp. P9(2023)]|uniref:SIMPL domain-containing protein n=1 Tax=Streptomyces sp. P9(2023) TaxID=3064394 RepID=UPI0028F45927|nr:SIMPL domain-containing protein [Streptomyces sp. P9(2023)]MDT9687818.1 SIMPL domain-containing protein [Streptomyces sp. P9(2023)]